MMFPNKSFHVEDYFYPINSPHIHLSPTSKTKLILWKSLPFLFTSKGQTQPVSSLPYVFSLHTLRPDFASIHLPVNPFGSYRIMYSPSYFYHALYSTLAHLPISTIDFLFFAFPPHCPAHSFSLEKKKAKGETCTQLRGR